MNKIALLLFIGIIACSSPNKTSNKQLIETYIKALNSSEFKTIAKCVTDSITLTEGGFLLVNSISTYATHFKWDSVFEPVIKLDSFLHDYKDSAEIIVSKKCKRIHYLHDTATVYKQMIHFENSKISRVENTDLIVFDFDKWGSRRDSLVVWIDSNYPELSGFIYDQTKNGAQNYLKAIDLYMKNKGN